MATGGVPRASRLRIEQIFQRFRCAGFCDGRRTAIRSGLLAIAAVLDGASRAEAAKVGGMDRQTLREWVIQFHEQGPDGLINVRSRPFMAWYAAGSCGCIRSSASIRFYRALKHLGFSHVSARLIDNYREYGDPRQKHWDEAKNPSCRIRISAFRTASLFQNIFKLFNNQGSRWRANNLHG
jgi:Helix-turn-helix domain